MIFTSRITDLLIKTVPLDLSFVCCRFSEDNIPVTDPTLPCMKRQQESFPNRVLLARNLLSNLLCARHSYWSILRLGKGLELVRKANGKDIVLSGG